MVPFKIEGIVEAFVQFSVSNYCFFFWKDRRLDHKHSNYNL